ncbi:ASCH domain-containing protein [Gallaecimonas mangrovi]|uniref:ASCH domain-containing protein n=1 Tax=Gallaecimonas mangrovi TaxID=2291597 RepID=UPI000E1FC632|nr:ASCH domain-containing protein [Gallaecimonas mangrovi]
MNAAQQAFLDAYLATLSPRECKAVPVCVAEHFCADEENANICAQLVNSGIKTATCSLKAAYDIEQQPLPAPGRLTVVLNWAQQPVCVIKTTTVSFCPFNRVPAAFAKAEGEGDGSYRWWYQAHLAFFNGHARELGLAFTADSELVLEHFEKVYPLE